jgi:hypothetical protein
MCDRGKSRHGSRAVVRSGTQEWPAEMAAPDAACGSVLYVLSILRNRLLKKE